jgi:hypothetical protein
VVYRIRVFRIEWGKRDDVGEPPKWLPISWIHCSDTAALIRLVGMERETYLVVQIRHLLRMILTGQVLYQYVGDRHG